MQLFSSCSLKVNGKDYTIKINDIFNKLTIKALYRNKDHKWYAICQCACGNKTERHVLVRHLITGNTKSCGCYNKELCINRSTKHNSKCRGNSDKLYAAWVEMRRRCNTKTCEAYKNYGGRGISITPEWEEFIAFKNWALANGYKDGLTIERLDVNGNYCPSNCTWIPKANQSKNRRTCNFIEHNGLCMTVTDWSRLTGIPRGTIYKRLKRNLPLNEVFESKHTQQ